MERFTCCIWDFNGTILDDVETGIKSVNKLLQERGLPTLDGKADYHKHFGFPIKKYYESLGFDFSKEAYEEIAPLWVNEYLINVKNAPLCEGVRDALELLRAAGIKQIIISATELDMLKGQILDLGISEYFDEVWGLDNIHAASKVALAEEWRNKNPDERAVFLGDTEHDFETAKAIGVECYLIEGGHQPRKTLEATGARIFANVKDACIEITKKEP